MIRNAMFYLNQNKPSVFDTVRVCAELCRERGIRPNELATRAGVTASTVYSLLDTRRRDVSVVTVKKLCDGLDITIGEFFTSAEFDALEQEIQ